MEYRHLVSHSRHYAKLIQNVTNVAATSAYLHSRIYFTFGGGVWKSLKYLLNKNLIISKNIMISLINKCFMKNHKILYNENFYLPLIFCSVPVSFLLLNYEKKYPNYVLLPGNGKHRKLEWHSSALPPHCPWGGGWGDQCLLGSKLQTWPHQSAVLKHMNEGQIGMTTSIDFWVNIFWTEIRTVISILFLYR